MPWYELNSEIMITAPPPLTRAFKWNGVHEVRVQRSINSIEDRATITVPSIAEIIKNGKKTASTVTTGTLFQDGDMVNIDLGYNGELKNEFMGFVKRRGTGMPLVIECEGYSYQLRNNVDISGDFRKTATSAKKLLALATKGTDITVQCPIDFSIIGVKLVKANGLQICDVIKQVSDHTLSIFFVQPKVLWCGLPFTAYAKGAPNLWGFPTVNYRLGWNCLRDNGLRERVPKEIVQVIMKGKYATGNILYSASKEKAAKNKMTHLSSQIGDNATMGKFAQEKAYRNNYTGYEGRLTGFLQPYANPAMDAYIVNKEYPELNGKYLIEETDVRFGMNGARRVLTIGPRVSFDNK